MAVVGSAGTTTSNNNKKTMIGKPKHRSRSSAAAGVYFAPTDRMKQAKTTMWE